VDTGFIADVHAGACTTFCSPYETAYKEAGSGDRYQVFLSHAGEQKRDFVDFLESRFKTYHPAVNVFLDEYSLPKGGEAMDGICAALRDACVGGCPCIQLTCT
jgi:hypothetical protein